MRHKFTAKYLDSLPMPADGERIIAWDSEVPKLGARRLPTRITLFIQAKAAGRAQRVTLGTYPELSIEAARKLALTKLGEIANWKAEGYSTPSPIRTKGTLTLAGAVADYCQGHLMKHAKNPKRASDAATYLLETYCPITMQTRPLEEITRNDIRKLHADVGEKCGHFVANRLLQMLRAAINYEIKMDAFDRGNCAEGITRFFEPKRKRPLTESEAPQFFRQLAKEKKRNRDLHDFTWLAPFVGARCGNIFEMTWSQLDLESKTPSWAIPDPKNRNPIRIELVPTAVRILKSRRTLHPDSEFVFPGDGETGHITHLYKAWGRFRKAAGVPDLRPHDLRHSAATFAKLAGVDDIIISRMLGHANPSVTRSTYINLPSEEVRKGFVQLEKKLLAVASAKPKREIRLPD